MKCDQEKSGRGEKGRGSFRTASDRRHGWGIEGRGKDISASAQKSS